MSDLSKLMQIFDTLLGKKGCPWDQKQTFSSLQPYFIEEVYELVDAIDEKDIKKIKEEAGDLLSSLIFLSKIAEKKGDFTLDDICKSVCEKLERRHPHIFEKENIKDAKEVERNWEKIKKKERKYNKKNSALDSIPKDLPLLSRGQKIIQIAQRLNNPQVPQEEDVSLEDLGEILLNLIISAEKNGISLESSLRKKLKEFEKNFRLWEENQKKMPEINP